MTKFLIREYKDSDYEQICQLMEVFQGYLANLDSMGICIVDEDYGKKYTDMTLKCLVDDNGKLLIVYEEGAPERIIGFGAGIAPNKANPFHVVGHIPRKEGIVTELFVLEEFRGHGLGKMLINELEKFFLENGCNYSRIGVMSDNKGAYQAYKKYGYQDRTVELLKKLVQ